MRFDPAAPELSTVQLSIEGASAALGLIGTADRMHLEFALLALTVVYYR